MALPIQLEPPTVGSLAVLTLPVSVLRAWALMRTVPSVLPIRGRRAIKPFLSVLRTMRCAALFGRGPLAWTVACAPVLSGKLASPASMVRTTGMLGSRLSWASRTTALSNSSGWALVSEIWLVPRSALIL